MKWLKENWFKIAILLSALVIFFSWLYVIKIKPSNIRKFCFNITKENPYAYNYKECIISYGLTQ
jgi:hypothetical protein